jgi:hypothetical protein
VTNGQDEYDEVLAFAADIESGTTEGWWRRIRAGLLLAGRAAERKATKADIAELADRLRRIESLLSTTR